MEILMGVAAFILGISLIVGFHEFGHYIVARMCGVRVEVFSLGFGPEICGWNDSHGTRWKISLLPLGGYVKMFCDNPYNVPAPEQATYEELTTGFAYKAIWQRALVVLAGPVANFVLALAICIPMAFAFNTDTDLTTLDKVEKGATVVMHVTTGIASAVGNMVSGNQSPSELGGPLLIGKVMGAALEKGLENFAFIVAVLSINIGLLNLFPMPVLDGGHLLLYGIEAIRGKPLRERTAENVFRVGFGLLLALLVFSTWNDLSRFFG